VPDFEQQIVLEHPTTYCARKTSLGCDTFFGSRRLTALHLRSKPPRHPGLAPDTPLQAKIILNHVPLSLSVSASLCQSTGKGIAASFAYTMLIALIKVIA